MSEREWVVELHLTVKQKRHHIPLFGVFPPSHAGVFVGVNGWFARFAQLRKELRKELSKGHGRERGKEVGKKPTTGSIGTFSGSVVPTQGK